MRAFPNPLRVAVLASSMAGCATRGQYVEPQTPLDSAILLVESDDHGNKYTISADDGDGDVVTRVGRPALVDINSTIRIRILKATLAAGTTPNSAQLDTLRAAQRRLTAAMESLAETLEKRAAAVAGYEAFWAAAKVGGGDSSLALAHFLELRSEFETADSDFLGRLLDIWPDEPDDFDAAVANMGTTSDLKRLIQAKLDSTNRAYEELVNDVTFTLRLEAFLESPNKDRVPLHVEGYDNLPEGQLERRDRFGLALEGAERDRFEDLVSQTQQLAAAGERVRTGEQSLEEAFRSISHTVLGDIADLAADVTRLAQELAPAAMEDRVARTQLALGVFGATVRTRVGQDVSNSVADLDAQVGAALTLFTSDITQNPDFTALMQTAGMVRTGFANLQVENLPALVTAIGAAKEQVTSLFESFSQASATVLALSDSIQQEIARLPTTVRSTVESSWQASEARVILDEWTVLAHDARGIVAKAEQLEHLVGMAPGRGTLHVPEARDVDLKDAPDTHIDLKRTPRLEADVIVLQATVLDSGTVIHGPLRTSLEVRRFGWHARLDPSVALVRPDRLANGSTNFRFAPAITWLHRYHPRPDATGLGPSLWRAMGMGGGIHAVFLNFDPDNSIEIGLGLTIALWNGILEGGAGINLMARERDQGRFYYLVASSLIPLLQAIGQTAQ